MRLWAAALLLLSSVPASALKTETLGVTLADGKPVEVTSGVAIVRFADGTTAAQKSAALAAVGCAVKTEWPTIGFTYVSLPAGMSVASGLTLLKTVPGVVSAEADNAYRANLTPNDSQVGSQYALSQVNAFSAWEFETGGSNVTTVAVLDAGVDSTHGEFAGKMAGLAHEFCDPDTGVCVAEATPLIACNHGTRVAGVAAALGNNSTGIAGLNWGAKVLSERIFRVADCVGGCGAIGCTTNNAGIIAAINHVITLQGLALYGKIVINLSIGGAGACNAGVQTAMNNAVAAGIPVVVASGNDGGAVNSPANCATAVGGTGIIPVGATDSLNNVTSFSSRGAELSANGLVAPGKTVLTTDVGGSFATADGTSFAAPHVAGLAALIQAKKPCANSLACVQSVQSTLRAGAENIGVSGLGTQQAVPQGNIAGAGRMNAFRSMKLAVSGSLSGFEGDAKSIAFPNPFRVSTHGTVAFTVPTALAGTNPKIKIYTADGMFVRELTGLTWDGKNDGGKLVASGTYIFLVTTGAGKTKGRVAVIR